MKYLPLAMAMMLLLSSFAFARERIAEPSLQNSSATIAASVQQRIEATLKLAMGPTSAAHLPGGAGASAPPAEDCAQTAVPCPILHQKAKARHKHFRNRS